MIFALLCDDKGPSAVCQQKFRTGLTLNYLYRLSSLKEGIVSYLRLYAKRYKEFKFFFLLEMCSLCVKVYFGLRK